jgi:hypothetical protein
MAETRQAANQAFDTFLEKYQAKYPEACECLKKDRDVNAGPRFNARRLLIVHLCIPVHSCAFLSIFG